MSKFSKKKFDSYYTPSGIAEQLVKLCRFTNPKSIADFAAGYGSLLEAAKLIYSESSICANDISSECVDYNKENNPDWFVSNHNFLDISVIEEIFLSKSQSQLRFDLILLNPPFSFRGGNSIKAFYKNHIIRCSPAFAFVVNSLNFLEDNGELIAILPSSCFTSDKDSEVRRFLSKYVSISQEIKLDRRVFEGCTVNTVCVRISKKLENINLKDEIVTENKMLLSNCEDTISIFRGKLSVHETPAYLCKMGHPFIHSTNLVNQQLKYNNTFISRETSTIYGPCVLIPRVCKPNLDKIVVYYSEEPIVISDCIIALFPNNRYNTNLIRSLITDNWLLFKELYSGTCAPYITLKRVYNFFNNYNIPIHVLDNIKGSIKQLESSMTE